MSPLKPAIAAVLSCLFITTGTLSAAEVVLLEEDFESGFLENTFETGLLVDVIDDPTPGAPNGKVARVDISGGAEWGALNSFPEQQLGLVANGIKAGSDTYELTADFFVPLDSTLAGNDRLSVIARFIPDAGESSKTEHGNYNNVDTLPAGEWFTLTMGNRDTGTVPATANTGPITLVRPIISVRDTANDGTEGTAVYIDNISFTAFTSGEDPGISAPEVSPFGAIRNDLAEFRTLEIGNLGTTQTLNITSLTLTGPDAASFTVDTPAPLSIPPGGTEFIDVTFNPGDPRAYSASLEIASNAVGNPTVSVPLNALVLPESTGDELIINGGFETGDTTGWGGPNISVTTEDPHSGNYAGVFTLPGGVRWNNLPLNQPAPPALENNPAWLEITPDMIDQLWVFNCWIKMPETARFGDTDEFSLIIRWNGVFPDARYEIRTGSGLFFDEWTEIYAEGYVPFEWGNEDPQPVTSAHLIFSFHDPESDSVGDERLFVDDFTFTVERAEVGPDVDLRITEVSHAFDDILQEGEVNLTFTSQPGSTYTIERSDDLLFWDVINANVPASPDPDTTTSFSDGSVGDAPVYHYRVRLNPAAP